MRTRRFNLWLLSGALLLAACGRPAQELTASPAQSEVAILKSSTQLGPGATARIRAPHLPKVDVLPQLPFTDEPLRVSSVLQAVTRQGSDSYTSGGGASNVGTTKLLSALPGSISWAVYQLPGIPSGATLTKLNVNVSGGVFGGTQPGYWVGLADFANNKWATLGAAQDNYQRLLSGKDYISPAANMYVFVLVMDSQTVSIDDVSATYDTVPPSGWSEVTLESGAGVGWTPSIVLDYYGNPWLAWSNHADGHPRYAFGLATDDLANKDKWAVGDIDPNPAGRAYYTDIVMDPSRNLPVASLNYVEQSAGADNSQAGMSVCYFDAQDNLQWLNFAFGKMDDARDTTIDFDPVSGFFGIATYATNANSPSKNANDMYVRFINLGVWATSSDDIVKVNQNFDVNMLFPHFRFNPAEQHARVVVDGARVFSDTNPPSSDNPTWEDLTEAANTGPFGSLAYNYAPAGPRYGITYAKDIGGNHVLFYNSYDAEGATATVEQVASISRLGGSEFIGGTSQLAYTWEGRPLIAYSVRQGSSVLVKFAKPSDAGWLNETVSSVPSDPGSTPQDVQVDLAVEPFNFTDGFARTNRAFVTWHDIQGSTGAVKVAFKVIN